MPSTRYCLNPPSTRKPRFGSIPKSSRILFRADTARSLRNERTSCSSAATRRASRSLNRPLMWNPVNTSTNPKHSRITPAPIIKRKPIMKKYNASSNEMDTKTLASVKTLAQKGIVKSTTMMISDSIIPVGR